MWCKLERAELLPVVVAAILLTTILTGQLPELQLLYGPVQQIQIGIMQATGARVFQPILPM